MLEFLLLTIFVSIQAQDTIDRDKRINCYPDPFSGQPSDCTKRGCIYDSFWVSSREKNEPGTGPTRSTLCPSMVQARDVTYTKIFRIRFPYRIRLFKIFVFVFRILYELQKFSYSFFVFYTNFKNFRFLNGFRKCSLSLF